MARSPVGATTTDTRMEYRTLRQIHLTQTASHLNRLVEHAAERHDVRNGWRAHSYRFGTSAKKEVRLCLLFFYAENFIQVHFDALDKMTR